MRLRHLMPLYSQQVRFLVGPPLTMHQRNDIRSIQSYSTHNTIRLLILTPWLKK
jgi:hypothetical protein